MMAGPVPSNSRRYMLKTLYLQGVSCRFPGPVQASPQVRHTLPHKVDCAVQGGLKIRGAVKPRGVHKQKNRDPRRPCQWL